LAYKLISKNGDLLSLMRRISLEGNKVTCYLPGDNKMYEGILPIVHDTTQLEIEPGDTVIFDMVGAGKTAEILKDKNYTVVGGGVLNDKLELDRGFGEEFMLKHGLSCPPTDVFTDFQEAKALVEKTGKRYVFKPNGNLETDLTYVSSSAENLLAMLDYLESKVPEGTEFELQEFVDGIEMSTEAWFNGERFLAPVNSTFEEKKFMAGGVGPNTGCMGNVVWAWDDEISEYLLDTLFRPMEDSLASAGYLGPLDINAIWNPEGVYCLEFTARFGYDAIQASSRLIDGGLGETLSNLYASDRLPMRQGELAVAVRVSIPPFPNEGSVPEIPIKIDKRFLDHVYLSDVYLKDGKLHCAGQDGYVLAVCDNGRNLPTILSKIAYIIEEIEIPGKQYRVDIGSRYPTDIKIINAFIRNMMKKPVDTYM
jgi:phosphoribosylamine--glycine ligase